MLAFTFSIFNNSLRRGTLRLMCRNVVQNNTNDMLQENFYERDEARSSRNTPRNLIGYTSKFLMEMENLDDKQWKDLTEKLNNMKISNVSTKILQACLRNNKLDAGISYYNYLTRVGQQLSDMDLLFFAKLLTKSKSDIQKHEELIIKLYNNIKHYLTESSLIRSFILEVFVEVPSCFYDIINNRDNGARTNGNLHIIRKALELNMPDVAYDYMGDTDFSAGEQFLESYLSFCIRKAEEGQFSFEYINNLITHCEKKTISLNHYNLGYWLRSLVNALMTNQTEYQWSVNKCAISERNVCLNCGLPLASKSISESDFQNLREHFFKYVFLRNNVFLNSSQKEVRTFLNFLDNCHPYDIVIDGLNVFYKTKHKGEQMSRCLSYFLEKDLRVLTIGKVHSRPTLLKPGFLNKGDNKRKAQFFFTSDTSDDDLFVLYATLLRGSNTFFVTGDHLASHSQWLDHEMLCLYLKWQISHQYLITPEGQLIPPAPHCRLSQLTQETTDKCIWHLSQQTIARPKVQVGTPINWYCLQAKRRKSSES